MEPMIIFVTASSPQEAQEIARHLLSQKLAACVNMINGVNSLFWWDQKIDQAQETLLIIKSFAHLFAEIKAVVKTEHSYSIPEILAFRVSEGSQEYLDWMSQSVKAA